MDSWDLKLDRAVEHIHALQERVDAWLDTDPAALVSHCDPDTREEVIKFRVFEQPPPSLYPLVGDTVHNIRQALDHVAFRLAERFAQPPGSNEDTAEFPVSSKRKPFFGSLASKVADPNLLPGPVFAVLDGAQPYNGGTSELLRLLHDLDRVDKHRFPPLVTCIGDILSESWGWLGMTEYDVASFGIAARGFKDDAEVGRVADGNQVQMHFEYSIDVAFDEGFPGDSVRVRSGLNAIHEYVVTCIVDPLRPFLE